MSLRPVSFLAIAALIGSVSTASAQEPDATLHHAQSGALLQYAEAEVQILYSTFLAKEFDPDLTKATLKELDRTIGAAKKSVDRTMLILGDPKIEPEMKKLLDTVKKAEKQLSTLSTDVEEQTGEKEKEPSDHRDEGEEDHKEEKNRDWTLLKNGAAWLFNDIKDARTQHAAVGKKLKGTGVKPPPKPSGKRAE